MHIPAVSGERGRRKVTSRIRAMQCYLSSQNLYESIKNEPFKIPEDDGNDLTHTFFNPDREGWLLKLGKSCPGLEHIQPNAGKKVVWVHTHGAQKGWGDGPCRRDCSKKARFYRE